MRYLIVWIIALIFIKTNVSDMLPSVIWSPWNPLFACPNPTINVQSKQVLRFICTYIDKKTKENLYLVEDENSFNACNATVSKTYLYCRLNGKQKDYVDIAFNKYTPDNSIPAYIPGKDYYFIGTADKDNLDNKVNGSCNSPKGKEQKKLRLKIHVCSKEEDCKICKTAGCYYQDCHKTCTEPTETFISNKTSCWIMKTWSCSDNLTGEHKEEYNMIPTICPTSTTTYVTTKEITSALPTVRVTNSNSASPVVKKRVSDDSASKLKLPIYILAFGCVVCLIGGFIGGVYGYKKYHTRSCNNIPPNKVNFKEQESQRGIVNDAYACITPTHEQGNHTDQFNCQLEIPYKR